MDPCDDMPDLLAPVQDTLVDALVDRKLLVCVGPGLATAAGLPGPRALVERCLAADERLKVSSGASVAKALEHAEHLLGSVPFQRLVREAWEREVPLPAMATALVGLAPGLNMVLTCNLDRLLERAFAGRWPAIETAAADVARRTRVIFKIRGTIDRPSGWLLTARQQVNAGFFGTVLQGELTALLRSHVVLFVGFDPDDEELLRLLSIRGQPVADPQHPGSETMHPDVVLVRETTVAMEVRDELGRRGVVLVPLADDAAITAYLVALAEGLAQRSGRTVPVNADEVEAGEPSEESPYPGLEPFNEERRRFFFGREDDVSRILGQLGTTDAPLRQWLMVDGPSGAGKSSLLHAGLVPALRGGMVQVAGAPTMWRVVTMRPGPAPVVELALQVHRILVGKEDESTASALAAEIQRWAPDLCSFVSSKLGDDEGLLLVIDQLEEALLVDDADARVAFAATLAELLIRSPRPVLLVTGLRSDFSGELPRLPALLEHMTSANPPLRYTLATLAATQLAAAIEQPARAARVEFEPGLVRKVLDDAGSGEGVSTGGDIVSETALPLVAVVMAELYARRAGRLLTHAAYDASGGVAGTLSRRADAALAPLMDTVGAPRLWQFFRKLFQMDPQGRVARCPLTRSDALAALGGGAAAEVLLARLTGGGGTMRLLFVRGDGAGARVDLVHEALLRSWTWLRERIEADRVELLREAEVTQAAERWQRLGRPGEGLPSGGEAEYFLRASTVSGSLADSYQAALRAHLRRQRDRGRTIVGGLLVGVFVLLVAAGVSFWQYREANHAAKRARDQIRTLAIRESSRDFAIRAALLREIELPWENRDWLPEVYEISQFWVPHIILGGHEEHVGSASFSPSGDHIVTASSDGTARVWRVDGSGMPVVLAGHEGAVSSASFSPDGNYIVTASEDHTARVWRTDGVAVPIVLFGHEHGVSSASFSPDGSRVVTTSADRTARVWRADGTDAPVVFGHEQPVWGAMFSPDGSRIVTKSAGNTARVWLIDGSNTPVLLSGHEDSITSASFSPDGNHIVTASSDGTARVWRAADADMPIVLNGHKSGVLSATFSPDGSRIVTASWDKTARVWRSDGEGAPIVLTGHEDGVVSAMFSSDGRHILTVSREDGTARVWQSDGEGAPIVLTGYINPIVSASFSPDVDYIVTANSWDKTAHVWRNGTDAILSLKGHKGAIWTADFSTDGSHIVTASSDSTARVWRADGAGVPVVLKGHEEQLLSASFSPDGNHVVTASWDKTARVWQSDGSSEPIVLVGHEECVRSAMFSPDGSQIVTASSDKTARVWRADGIGTSIVLAEHEGSVEHATFSPDGSRIVTASADNTARVWRTDGTSDSIILAGHEGPVNFATFSPDGSQIVTASHDRTARLWRVEGGEPVILSGHEDPVRSAMFSPDGSQIVTASHDKTARVWRVDGTGGPVVLRGHQDIVWSAIFSPDGSLIATASFDGTARLWQTDGTTHPGVLPGPGGIVYAATFSPDGGQIVTAGWQGTARVWALFSIEQAVSALWNATPYCIPERERIRRLRETEVEANSNFAICEAMVAGHTSRGTYRQVWAGLSPHASRH